MSQKHHPLNRPQKPTQSQIQKAFRRDSAMVQAQASHFESMKTTGRGDGWANVMTGLGGPMDKRAYTFYGKYPILPDPELERMYFGDGIAARLIDSVADDMTREWVELKAPEKEEGEETGTEEEAIETVGQVLNELDAQGVYNEALKWARLYGGACIVIGALDGQDLSQPLNPKRISSIDYLRVIDRTDIDLFQSVYQNDPNLPGYGKPEQLFMYFQVGVMRYPRMVHASRCIFLKGKKIPTGATPTSTLNQRFWGLSELNRSYEALADYNTMCDSITNTFQELVVGKYKMAGLASMMAEGKEGVVQTRMQLISLMKSNIHGVMLDAENEDYSRDSLSLAGIAEVLDRASLKICATGSIPYVRLFGDSPGGLSTDDKAGLTNYYDGVRARQHNDLKPAIRKLVDIILGWKYPGQEVPLEIEFNPLESLNEKEQAEVKNIEATAELSEANMYRTYMDSGVLDAEQVYTLKWAERMKGLEIVPLGPQLEGEEETLDPEEEGELEQASAKNQGGQKRVIGPNTAVNTPAGNPKTQGGQGVGPDAIGKGLG